MSEERPRFQAPKGFHDILPSEQKYYEKLRQVVQEMAEFFGFSQIETPILESAELFSRGIGLSTEIVQKQMFTLKTKGDDLLALRPELTAPVARAYIEHGMRSWPQPVKLWYFGPCFRYERPQAGRFRQFWQWGLETLGQRGALADAQIIQISYNILEKLKFKKASIQINSIGCPKCRPYSKRLLREYLRPQRSALCADCKRRFKENLLRILDCKEEKCQRVVRGAPQIIDHLCKWCHNHFKEVLEFLDEIGLPYRLNPYLVRGLDYYTKTVFEMFEEAAGSALLGGGRYDGLIQLLGGEDTPAVGVAAGVERIIEGMKKRALRYPQKRPPTIFLAQVGNLAQSQSLKILDQFRRANLPVAESLGRRSLRAQLKRANQMGVKYVLILGQKEVLEGKILLRNMETGKQRKLLLKRLVETAKKLK